MQINLHTNLNCHWIRVTSNVQHSIQSAQVKFREIFINCCCSVAINLQDIVGASLSQSTDSNIVPHI